MSIDIESKRIIDLTKNTSYQTYRDVNEELDSSLYQTLYNDCKKNVEKISKLQTENDFQASNIIMFSGDRGTGKSSSMKSFASFLEKNSYISNNISFHVLKTIDPTMLGTNDSILEIIIAELLESFENLVKSNADVNNQKKREVLEIFKSIYKELKTIYEDRVDRFKPEVETENTMETIKRFSSSLSLEKNIKKLIDEVLKINSKSSDGKRFLVIPIDDLDMNLAHAFNMLEEIRKYLSVNNIIILFAGSEVQLVEILKEKFRINTNRIFGNKDATAIAGKYLTKLLPFEYRLYMPDIADLIKSKNLCFKYTVNETDTREMDATEYILSQIYEKTRLIFLKDKYETNDLIPTNLRDLIFFAQFLKSLEEVGSSKFADIYDEGKSKTILRNLVRFKEYFLNIWCRNTLTYNDYSQINKMFNSTPDQLAMIASGNTIKNATFANTIKEIEAQRQDPSNNETKKISAIYCAYSIIILELILTNETKEDNFEYYNNFGLYIDSDDMGSIGGINNEKRLKSLNLPLYDIFTDGNILDSNVQLLTKRFAEIDISNIYGAIDSNNLISKFNDNNHKDEYPDEDFLIYQVAVSFISFYEGKTKKEILASPIGRSNAKGGKFDIRNPFYYLLHLDYNFFRSNRMFKNLDSKEKWQNHFSKYNVKQNIKTGKLNSCMLFPVYSIDMILVFERISSFGYKEKMKDPNSLFERIQILYKIIAKLLSTTITSNPFLKESHIEEYFGSHYLVNMFSDKNVKLKTLMDKLGMPEQQVAGDVKPSSVAANLRFMLITDYENLSKVDVVAIKDNNLKLIMYLINLVDEHKKETYKDYVNQYKLIDARRNISDLRIQMRSLENIIFIKSEEIIRYDGQLELPKSAKSLSSDEINETDEINDSTSEDLLNTVIE